MSGSWKRLYRGETTVNFYGRRRIGFMASGLLLVVTIVSLFINGLNLGIDFKGGTSFEAPVTATLDTKSALSILAQNGVVERDAKVQVLTTQSTQRLRIQIPAVTDAVSTKIQQALATAAKATVNDVSVSKVSSTWGRNITMKAVKALLVFFGLVSLYIAWRFEWRMALSAIIAMAHDVGISVGVYSVLKLEVTPATVVAFLTILGFSLYDTIVVFDKVHDNTHRFSGSKASYGDIVNVSMNQVLMRSLNTSIAALLPVLSLLVLGAGAFGAVALQEFALALLVGLATGAYSSIFIASPLLGILKSREPRYAPYAGDLAVGVEMAHLMATGAPAGRKAGAVVASADATDAAAQAVSAEALLSHPPRPRKKKSRR